MSLSIILSLASAIPVFVAMVALLGWAIINPAQHGRGLRLRTSRPAGTAPARPARARQPRALKPLQG